MAEVINVPVEKLMTGDYAVRAQLEDETLDELARSIAKLGLLVPLLVAPDNDGYVVVAGHRRLRACRKIGLDQISCIIVHAKEEFTRAVSFAENMFRRDLTPIEEAAAIRDLIANDRMTLERIGSLMQRSTEWVQGRLDLLAWPDEVQEVVHMGILSAAAAKNLAAVSDDVYRGILLRQAVESGATARTTAAWLQAWRAAMPLSDALQAEPVPGRPETPAAVLLVACVMCNEHYDATKLAYLPICPRCVDSIRGAVGNGRPVS